MSDYDIYTEQEIIEVIKLTLDTMEDYGCFSDFYDIEESKRVIKKVVLKKLEIEE